jgi:hypothetical protein
MRAENFFFRLKYLFCRRLDCGARGGRATRPTVVTPLSTVLHRRSLSQCAPMRIDVIRLRTRSAKHGFSRIVAHFLAQKSYGDHKGDVPSSHI